MTTSTSTPDRPSPETSTAHQDAITRLEGAFGELMAEFRRYYARAAETASPGMLPATFKVLATIGRAGPITVSGLAERLSADKGQMSRSVSELEAEGFVERTTDATDGRVRMIATTALGDERLAAARSLSNRRMLQTLQTWPTASIDTLADHLSALTTGAAPPR